ncbi:helix-turn-helix domain-containing GNAT family N-acetyltransferase [Agrobacterium vitis]|uniref:bifunctional helix-turn-helix transcriptional regulator/GNAT family N-acetyltransferase n=1 Tax=Agrobacterium vitis TaxID=373 RepID=UPI0012E97573|nr:helix-turn-helix domain-containing GNAT family N-acetyltransferase [Agrobacterium vitis]MVA25645.1 GNAT family N-acetyltransferase [Agrobacterium vitis]
MMQDHSYVEAIRASSRQLVRELGFMGGDFAGTDLPPSAVHALIEIDACPDITARDLGHSLRLEKSSVSRMLRRLISSGDLLEEVDKDDSRIKRLRLSESGLKRTETIHAFARHQVSNALDRLRPNDNRRVLDGLRLYVQALANRGDATAPEIEIVQGYRPGLIARITQMHALYYARMAGFGLNFECVVATGLADFCNRLGNSKNSIWLAMQAGEIVGSIAIDGEDLGAKTAHLRWFIIDDGMRGGGIGGQLLSAALAYADEKGFEETHLWTFSGLTTARHLYESHGFVCVEERTGNQWGSEVLEQKFVRPRQW